MVKMSKWIKLCMILKLPSSPLQPLLFSLPFLVYPSKDTLHHRNQENSHSFPPFWFTSMTAYYINNTHLAFFFNRETNLEDCPMSKKEEHSNFLWPHSIPLYRHIMAYLTVSS